jgi:integrase
MDTTDNIRKSGTKTRAKRSSRTALVSSGSSSEDALFDRRIEIASEGLTSYYSACFYKIPLKENALTLASYIISLNSEVNPSNNYRREIIDKLSRFSIYCDKTLFKDITREQLLKFLDSLRKPEDSDPLHKWIGTYNLHRLHFLRFFKWLHYPDIEQRKRPKPPLVENIPQLKRKEISIYKPSDLWTNEDDAIFLRYCPSKRMKCYHAVSGDTSCRPHEILKLRIKDIVFKTVASNHYQYAEVFVNGKTGSRHLPLINSIPYVKDWLDHEHPQPSNPNCIFLCGFGKNIGRALNTNSLRTIYEKYRHEFFPKLLESPDVQPEDKAKIKELLKKPWNPYIRRHSALTQKSTMLKEHVLRQHAGWSGRSQMHLKYLHYFGNESNDSILQAYGIIPKDLEAADVLRPKQCPNCQEPNKPDSKFCAKCRMVLTYDAYNETLEGQKQKDDQLNAVQSQLDSMQSQIQSLMSAFSTMKEQPQVDSMAKTLYSSGILVKAENKGQQQLIKAAGKAAYHATRTKSALTREAEKSKAKTKKN